MFLRPMKSETDDHTNRPAMFARDRMATKPAAALAEMGVGVLAKKLVIMGAAFSTMPIPAVTLKQRTIHRHQNCGVRIALRAETFAVVTRPREAACAGS